MRPTELHRGGILDAVKRFEPSPQPSAFRRLLLAGQFLDRHPGSQRIVMVVTDGEPTAHLISSGEGWFQWPPSSETIAETVAQGRATVEKEQRREGAMQANLEHLAQKLGFVETARLTFLVRGDG